MLSSFRLKLPKWFNARGPGAGLRVGAAALLIANCVAAYFLIRPLGGSPEELRQELSELRTSLRQHTMTRDRSRALAGKVGTGRAQGSDFLNTYFLARRTAYSTVLAELESAAKDANIQAREITFGLEAVEGSDALEILRISANYVGSYADLLHFLNRMDKSPRLLIIDALQATPQQQGEVLNVNMKLDAFVREETGAAAETSGGSAEASGAP